MKTLRSLLALAFAAAFATTAAFADHHGKKADAKPEKAACGCVVKADGKVCGVDSDCCCTGEKAKGKDKAAKKADKKACCAEATCAESGCKADKSAKSEKADKKADKKSDKYADKKAGKKAGKAGADCADCTACAAPKADKK